jgi:hypothetical protein
MSMQQGEGATAPSSVRGAMVLVTWEGIARTMGLSLCSGVFLAGFAAALGADERAMGFIGAMPSAGELLQLVSAQIIASAGSRRRVFIGVNIIAALLWAGLSPIAFTLAPSPALVWAFVVIYGVDAFCASTRNLAWLDWMRDLIPASLRGRYFARRNRLVLLAGLLLSLPAAKLVDWFKAEHAGQALMAYGVLFGLTTAFLLASVFVAGRVQEPSVCSIGVLTLWRTAVRSAWASRPFRRYFVFRFLMNFAMSMSGPLLIFYLLRELHYSSTFVASLGVMATVLTAATLLLWGKLADRVGNRPAMVLIFIIKLAWAGLWVFVTPDSFLLLIVIYVLSAHGSGSELVHQNMLMKLVPREGAAAALGMFNSLTVAASVFAPVLGGYLVHSVLPPEVEVLGVTFSNWQGLILISTFLRFAFTFGLIWVEEPASMPVRHFVRVLWRGFMPEEPVQSDRELEDDESSDAGTLRNRK